MPAEPARKFFQGLIEELARRFDAPVFEPHVTVHVGTNHAGAAEKALAQSAHECEPINLEALGMISPTSLSRLSLCNSSRIRNCSTLTRSFAPPRKIASTTD